MKKVHAGSLVGIALMAGLLGGCASRVASNIVDCGDGIYSNLDGDKRYSDVVSCLQKQWDSCSEAVGSLTRYTIEGDPIVSSYYIRTNGDTCTVKETYDGSQDRFGGEERMIERTCTKLSIEAGTPPSLIVDACD